MQRIFMFLVLIGMIMLAGLIAAPLLVNVDGYKTELLKTIKGATGLEPSINGRIKLTFVPIPSVTVTNVTIDNIKDSSSNYVLSIESIEVGSSIQTLLTGKVDIKDITLIHPILELEELNDGTKNWASLEKSITNRDTSGNYTFPDKIKIINGTISHTRDLQKSSLDYFTAEIEADSIDGPFKMSGNFASKENMINFGGNIGKLKEGAEADFKLGSTGFNVSMKGKYKAGDNPRIEGTLEGGSTNLTQFVNLFFDHNSSFSQITSKEQTKISGSFELSEKIASFKDIVIESENVSGNMSLSAKLNAGDADKNMEWDIATNIDKLDIDKLFKKEDISQKEAAEIDYYSYSANTFNLSDFTFDIPKSLTASFNLGFNNITYNNNKISNIKFVTDINQGRAKINDISANLPGDSSLKITGNVDHNGTRPLFNGNLEISGHSLRQLLVWSGEYFKFIPEDKMQEFLLSSDLKITPQKIDLTNTQLSFDQSLINASASVRPAKTIPMINANINIDRMDLDSYGITQKLYEEIKDFTETASKAKLDQTWLSRLKSLTNLTINAKDIVYNHHYIDSNVTTLVMARNLLNLQRFTIDSDITNLSAKLFVNLKDYDKPQFNFSLRSKGLDTALFIPKDIYEQKNDFKWSNDRFNLMGIGRFSGDIKLEIDNFRHKDFITSDIKAEGSMKERILDVPKFNAKLYDGDIKLKGKMGFSETSPSIGVAYAITDVSINPLIKNFKESSDTTGRMYVTGSFNSAGATPLKWILNLDSKAKFAAKDVVFTGFDLGTIIKKSKSVYSVIDMNETLKTATVEGVTKFDWVEGAYKTSKGIMQIQDTKMISDISRGAFNGNISLANFEINSATKLSFKPERNKNVGLTLKLTGSLMDVQRELDKSNLELYITEKGRQ